MVKLTFAKGGPAVTRGVHNSDKYHLHNGGVRRAVGLLKKAHRRLYGCPPPYVKPALAYAWFAVYERQSPERFWLSRCLRAGCVASPVTPEVPSLLTNLDDSTSQTERKNDQYPSSANAVLF